MPSEKRKARGKAETEEWEQEAAFLFANEALIHISGEVQTASAVGNTGTNWVRGQKERVEQRFSIHLGFKF